MIDEITYNGVTLAYIIASETSREKTYFPTPPELELQVGYVVHPAGGVVKAHAHLPVRRTVERTCEVVVVKEGRCDVDLYADGYLVVATRDLRQGDVLILVSGGHGFRMKEDTVLLEVKQGPYFGAAEKRLLQ